MKLKEKVVAKKELTDDFTFNFYDKLINQEQKNRQHDQKVDEYKGQTKEALIPKEVLENMGAEMQYRMMMREINSNNKKFMDAIRNKSRQELKDFKKAHGSLLKSLATSEKRKKT